MPAVPVRGHAEAKTRCEKEKQLYEKTQLCKYFSRGHCFLGKSCRFAHGQEQLRQQPDLFKTRLCADYMRSGGCRNGASCKFAHGRQELRSLGQDKPDQRAREELLKLAVVLRSQVMVAGSQVRPLRPIGLYPTFMLQPVIAGCMVSPPVNLSRQTTYDDEALPWVVPTPTDSDRQARSQSDRSISTPSPRSTTSGRSMPPNSSGPEQLERLQAVMGAAVVVKNSFLEVLPGGDVDAPPRRRSRSADACMRQAGGPSLA
eukprot:CAMPEP_0176071330 /NCGR_PEP_ID=MMETSP0120_2-20121206/35626_1 /TAXON_ID=160619 /ORGANISM="Kryptoperidinium foliaceum, Strain CCMP 1326" /LENGTH=258 /DNA_ID=CAMNT_0017404985 /DNA_START=78 /DNA_END=854 /DNA_ORIENTATION=+